MLLTVYPGATCIFFGLAGPTRKRFSRVEYFLMCIGEIISDLASRYKSTPKGDISRREKEGTVLELCAMRPSLVLAILIATNMS